MKKLGVVMLAALICMTGCGGNGATEADKAGAQVETAAKADTVSGYIFEHNGVKIGVDMEAAPIIEQLGEPNNYFEANSCAFQGLDKMYDYGDFEINTYEENGKDYISYIVFRNDMVETPEGVGLFMTKADMIDAYGENYTDENGEYVYEKDGMKLKFICEGEEIISLEYASTFLEQ